MIKKARFDFDIPIFGSRLFCFIGYNSVDFVKTSLIKKLYSGGKRDMSELAGIITQADGITIRAMPENYYIVWISGNRKRIDNTMANTISHEICHVVQGILSDCGIRLSDDTREVYAYFQGWLTEKIYDKLA